MEGSSAKMKTAIVDVLHSSNYITVIGIILINVILNWNPAVADLEKYSFLKSQLYIHGVVPEVIHEAPPHEIQVMFHQGFPLEPGKKLGPKQVVLPPLQMSWPAHEKGYYLLALMDPDSPNRTKPVDREYLHWLVGNVPGVAVSRGAELMPYCAPLPEKGTGVHRYVFIVFQQTQGVVNYEDALSLPKRPKDQGRRKFNTVDFAQKYGLGDAIAVTFFRMEWDENYVNSTIHL